MHANQLSYLPLPLPFFSILVGIFVVLVLFLQIRVLRYAYMHIGLSSGAAFLVLLGSLVGAYFNIPVAELPGQQVVSGQVISFYGMQYVVPVVTDWPGTVIAVNVGGAVIPTGVSIYLIIRHELWIRGILAIALVAAITHYLAHPVAGLGIALPVFVPAISTAIVALVLSRQFAAPLAYIGGSVGTLVGADLLNLGKIGGLDAPIASIGGAGTFDGIFVTGILAVVIASLSGLFRSGSDLARQ